MKDRLLIKLNEEQLYCLTKGQLLAFIHPNGTIFELLFDLSILNEIDLIGELEKIHDKEKGKLVN